MFDRLLGFLFCYFLLVLSCVYDLFRVCLALVCCFWRSFVDAECCFSGLRSCFRFWGFVYLNFVYFFLFWVLVLVYIFIVVSCFLFVRFLDCRFSVFFVSVFVSSVCLCLRSCSLALCCCLLVFGFLSSWVSLGHFSPAFVLSRSVFEECLGRRPSKWPFLPCFCTFELRF